jgi:uncharacterized protein (TIGR02246 family)
MEMPATRPEQCDLMMCAAINAGNLDEALALYEPNAAFISEVGKTVTGTDAIREALAGMIAMNVSITVEVPLVVESGDTALLHSQYVVNSTGADGNPVSTEGKGVEIVRRQADGTWKFIIDNPFGAP